jgi:1-acyl-sn-glycerol-3-phosphate acyltransferase
VRAAGRGTALALCTAVVYAVLAPTELVLRLAPSLRRRWRDRLFRRWSKLVMAILAVRLEVRGTAPQPPFLLVTNHLGYLDVPLLASRLPARFVAKAEVRRWPVIGLFTRSVSTIFVDRTLRRDVLRVGGKICAAIAEGDGVILFPEGTSTAGHDVAPFRSALLAEAADAGIPVHYATIRYRTPPGEPPASETVCWWGDMSFAPHLGRLLSLSAIEATLVFGAEPIRASCRKRLAARLNEAVRTQLHGG